MSNCEVCGAPTRSAYGVCQRTTACRTKFSRLYKQDPGKSSMVCPFCRQPTWSASGVCTKPACRSKSSNLMATAASNTYQMARELVFEHYGVSCACCGTTEQLTIDHIAGDGKQHRIDTGGPVLYVWLWNNKFPGGFQTLCFRCNTSKGRGFTCALHDYKFLGPEELRFYFKE